MIGICPSWGCGRDKKVEEVCGEHTYEGIPGHG